MKYGLSTLSDESPLAGLDIDDKNDDIKSN